MVAGVRQQRRDVGVGGGSGGDVLAAAEMLYVVNLKNCVADALLRSSVTARCHA